MGYFNFIPIMNEAISSLELMRLIHSPKGMPIAEDSFAMTCKKFILRVLHRVQA